MDAYERSEDRRGYANGYKPKTVRTRVGELTLAVPQVREGGFYPQSLEKGLRSERALKVALVEMYVSGVSTRKVARISVFPSVVWQRCQFHLQQNAGAYLPRQDLRKPVAAAIRDIFNAPDIEEAKRLLKRFTAKYQSQAPKLVAWAAEALPEGFAVFALPESHRRRLRTTNALERVNKEIKRRTRVATLFPNEQSCERLVTAVVMEISEEWVIGKTYLNMENEAE